MIAADSEPAAYAYGQLARLGSDDIYTRIRRAEGCAGQRAAVLLVPAKQGVEQQMGGGIVRVRHGDVLHPHLVAAVVYLQQIRFGVEWLLVEIRKKVADRKLILALDVICFQHELVIGPVLAGSKIVDLLELSVGKRDRLQEILGNRTEATGRNLVAGEGSIAVHGVGKLHS